MNNISPGSQKKNQLSASNENRIKEQKSQNDNSEDWETYLRGLKDFPDYFNWLLKTFYIPYSKHNDKQEKQRINAIKKALQDPKQLIPTFYLLYKKECVLSRFKYSDDKSQKNNSDLKNENYSNTSSIQTEKEELKQTINDLEQEKESQVIKLNKRIDELERENQELRESKSSLLRKLSDRDRDTSNTITSDESRPQRDVLTENFIQLKTQEITSVGHEIFNHLSQINSDLKVNRKREIAKIKYVFSQQIFDKGSQCFTGDNSIGEDKFPQVVEDFTTSILTDLQITEAAKFPEPIPTNLKNLVEKGLKLVKEIVNDDPPGHFLIASQGETFNPENHEPVPGCEPSGQIVYTTYPGYCVNNRIIGESLKASVFTEPDKQPEDQEEQPSENNQNHQQPNSIENEQQSPCNQQLKPTSNHQNPVPQPSENNQTHQPPNSTENKQ